MHCLMVQNLLIKHIEGGNWLNEEPYLTIHRLAGDGQVHGLFPCALNYCKKISLNIRVDTHADNKTMQRLIEKEWFYKMRYDICKKWNSKNSISKD